MKISIPIVASLLLFSTIFYGCKKAAESVFDENIQRMAKENALAQAVFDDISKVAENILMNNADAKVGAAGAPLGCITNVDTIVLSPTSKLYTVSFDPTCTSYDGKARRGILKVLLNGTNYNTTGSSIEVTFEDFHVNNYHIQGKLTLLNEGSDTFLVTVSDAASTGSYASVYVYDTGKPTFWKSKHRRVLYEGNGDMIIINNKYKIQTANEEAIISEGITTDNGYYFGTLIDNYVMDYSCIASGRMRYPTYGYVKLNLEGKQRYLNYGDLTCDTKVEMNWSGSSTALLLY